MLSQPSHLSLSISQLRENPNLRIKALCSRVAKGASTSWKFLKSCFTEGFQAVVAGRYNRRQAAIIIAGSLPAILGALMITLPGVMFPTPGHQAFYHFAATLGSDLSSMVPVVLGAVSSVLGLKIPLG